MSDLSAALLFFGTEQSHEAELVLQRFSQLEAQLVEEQLRSRELDAELSHSNNQVSGGHTGCHAGMLSSPWHGLRVSALS